MDEYPIIDLSHLLPAAQGLARLPADERVQRIRADRWIGYPRAVEALNRLETLYAWPNKQRMPNLLLVGPTNNGKSMIIEKFRRTHPASSDADRRQHLKASAPSVKPAPPDADMADSQADNLSPAKPFDQIEEW